MIQFQRIFYKNLLATGDRGIEIMLNKHPTTLIIGANGAGKSTILDALSFALYGKGFRNVTKAQLMNSINDKDCRVELDFLVGSKQYQIIRSMKPNKFEIHCDGKLLNQDANARDYQKYLEVNVLKMNEKSFRQIVVLGSADYIPFMQLKAQDRRSIIEDLLDINVFSDMNKLLKEKVSSLKLDSADATHAVALSQQKMDSYIQYEEEDTERVATQIKAFDKTIVDHQDAIKSVEAEIKLLQDSQTAIVYSAEEHETHKKQQANINKLLAQAETKKSMSKKLQDFFEANHSCATCSQGITVEHRNEMIADAQAEIDKIVEAETKLNGLLSTCTSKLQNSENNLKSINDLKNQMAQKQNLVGMSTQMIKATEENKANLQKQATTRNVSRKAEITKELTAAQTTMNAVKKDLDYHNIAATILKDDGIKTRIVKQYLPVINQLINKYLTTLGLSADFHLDDKFDETLKSRYRDEFTYASFSEGEKARIDLSIMLTWRAIAKMKNSANTNLLILDETFDGSLDGDATEELLGTLNGLEKSTNIFVISHRNDSLYDKFKNLIEFEKVNNFSQMKDREDDET